MSPGIELGLAVRLPAGSRWVDRQDGRQGRHRVQEREVQRAVTDAAGDAGIVKRATPRTFRRSFATHLLADGYDVGTVQELLGHSDVKTTMICTHVLNRACIKESEARRTGCSPEPTRGPIRVE